MSDNIYDTISYRGYTIEIVSDYDAGNPRTEWDNAAHMVCWHSRYDLGDSENWKGVDGKRKSQNISKKYDEPIDLLYELAGFDKEVAQKNQYYKQILDKFKKTKYYKKDEEKLITDEEYLKVIEDVETGIEHTGYEKDDWAYQISKYLNKEEYWKECSEDISNEELCRIIEERGTIISPLYLYDHSGITISMGPFSCSWDSGQVGWIYMTKDDIGSCYGDTSEDSYKKAWQLMEGEVETYNQYLTGEVYGYRCDTGDIMDSCWGYYGDPKESGCIADAKSHIDHYIKHLTKDHIKKVKEWIRNKVPLIYRKPLILQ